MKNLLIGICLVLLTVFGCKDDEPKPTESIQLEDLCGTWVSVDSMIGRLPDSTLSYLKDTVQFLFNHQYSNNIFIEKCMLTERGVYQFDYYLSDSMEIRFLLYRNSGILPIKDFSANLGLSFSMNKDTIELFDLSSTYPYTRFNRFYKL